MIASAALLIRERGARPTAMGDVLAHSGAPRGSAYHYFPGGRNELLCEAVDYAAEYVTAALSKADSGSHMLDIAVAFYREGLLASDFRAGCPVLAVAVEAGDPGTSGDIIARTAAAFERWRQVITTRLVSDGFSQVTAAELANLVIAALEGALVMARAERDLRPLDAVHRQLRGLLTTDTERNRS
jgi:AcrR family transcriptional regulator